MISADKRINVRSNNSDKSLSMWCILSSVSTKSDLHLGLLNVSISNPELDVKSLQIEFAADGD